MKDTPLTREEVARVIEGKGAARRVPMAVHLWTSAETFGERAPEFRALLDDYPCDIQQIYINVPSAFDAPADDPNYRWLTFDNPFPPGTPMDAVAALDDWDMLPEILEHFPDPNYPGLIPANAPADDGRYRVGLWWYWLCERHWSLRGMENALCDYYEYPEEVHKLYRALTDFYKAAATRAKNELGLDAIWTSDDIGTQKSPFFSMEIFETFFAPYYKELVDHCHSLGMHFWMHCCGNIEPILPRLTEMGIDVIHPIQKYTMEEKKIAEAHGDKICIWAGFDVQQTIPYGTPEEVRQEVRFMYDTYYRKDGRLILAAGNHLTPDTPFESLEALLDEALTYGTAIGKA